MEFSELFYSAQNTAHGLSEHRAVKGAGAIVMAAAGSMHGQLLLAFCGLVFIDLITKWLALSKEHLSKKKRKKPYTLWEIVKNIPRARAAGYIKSEVMKSRFVGKIIVYLLIVIAAGLVDHIMQTMQNPTWAVVLAVGYLSVTELVSILENLQDAGVEEAGRLHDLVENRKNMIK